MSDKDGKTEEPTPKKIEDARKKGQIAKSQDLNAGASLLVFTLALSFIGNYIFKNLYLFLKKSLGNDLKLNLTRPYLKALAVENVMIFFSLFLPIAGIGLIVGIVTNLVQTRFLHTSDTLKPDIKKLNPIQGFKNIFSKKSMITLLKNLLKLILVFYMSYKNLSKNIYKIFTSGNLGLESLFIFFISFLKDMVLDIVVVMFVLGVLDYFLQKRDHKKNLMMTKDELKEEFKQMEGNQEIKAARRQRQRELAMGRMMQGVEDSTVVITNPTHVAVAIRYDRDRDDAPILMAKGAEHIAKKIREKAKESKIPIVENKVVARSLYASVEVGDNIPAEFYQVVAEILVLVYEMEEGKKKKGKI